MLRIFFACFGLALALAAGDSIAQPSDRAPPITQQQAPEPPQAPAPPVAQPPSGGQATVPVRVTDQPVAVRVVQPPKTDAQFDAEQKERDERAALGDQLLIYAALLVAVVAFLAVAFMLQAFYLGLGMRAMRRSAQLAQRNVTAAQRAFVYLDSLSWSNTGGYVSITPIWANSGTTPSRRLRISTNWKASHGELSPGFEIRYSRPPDDLFLGPNGKAELGEVLIPLRDIQAAIEERLQLHVWGRATYEDVFEGTKPHFFDFCHRVEATGAIPDNVSLTFTQFGLNNGSDQDARPQTDSSS
jgi:hypothetical protein